VSTPFSRRYAFGMYAALGAYFSFVFHHLGLFLAQHVFPQTPQNFSVLNPRFSLYNNVFTLILTFVMVLLLFVLPKIREHILDSAEELTQISWSGLKETQKSTGTVIVFVIISSLFLFMLDFIIIKFVNSIIGISA